VCETNPAKASLIMSKEKIQLSTFVYLHPDVLEDIMKPVKDDIWVKHTQNYGKEEAVIKGELRLSDKDFIPKDLFWDSSDQDRIGILILAPAKFDFMGGFEEYRLKVGAEPFEKSISRKRTSTSKNLALDEIKIDSNKKKQQE